MNLYDNRRIGRWTFMAITIAVVGFFLYVSNNLVNDLATQERERMQIWADATKQIVSSENSDIDFLLSIINQNHTIPVLLVDDNDNILDHRNFDLPEPVDPAQAFVLSEANEAYLLRKLHSLKGTENVIHIVISAHDMQHLYYEDSKLLKRLSYYPYVQILVMLAFIIVVYYAVLSMKKAEQNKVWVGLSKETAHQLGTPISSLMAWMELLQSLGVDPATVSEMNKDVTRLSTIASRFSKIGSKPQMEEENLNAVVAKATSYMSTRISTRISMNVELTERPLPVRACAPLLEWVMENLVKNAVDAMDGSGRIDVSTGTDGSKAWVTVTDTGKGISRKNFKTIFSPGFTTKKRGWGLGLTLAKRIVEEYHLGRIYVAQSEIGSGTTFRIDLPLLDR